MSECKLHFGLSMKMVKIMHLYITYKKVGFFFLCNITLLLIFKFLYVVLRKC
jgi:hypothetical protein